LLTGDEEISWDYDETSQRGFVYGSFATIEQREVIDKAEQVWTLWIDFFRSTEKKILGFPHLL